MASYVDEKSDRYSEYIFPSFPVVDLGSNENGTQIAPDVLAAIYVISQGFATFDEVLCIQTVYETLPLQTLKDFVWTSLHKQRNRPTLSSIQAALLIALTPADNMLMPENDERASLAGMIAAMANALGLQHDPTNWSVPNEEKAIRKRLSCLVKANDTWTAVAAGRPPFLSPDNWLLETISSSDHTNSMNETTLTNFVQYTRLTQILGDILRNV